MFVRKRGDTKVGSIEQAYGIDLNARSDTRLDTLLRRRGFDSLSQLMRARSGRLRSQARRRRAFTSFHHEDARQVQGFRLMLINRNIDLDLYDLGLRVAINSERSSYIKAVVRERISRSSVAICFIGNRTAWRPWVEWELRTALELGKGICGVRLKGARGPAPSVLRESAAPIVGWGVEEIVSAIERAAATRS